MLDIEFSRSSVTRHLKINRALTSVNFNGQFYTLPGTVKFNRYGLGKIDGKVFSRHGNLLDTITVLAENSVSGISPADIERLVETNVQSQCLELFKKGKLFRKKYGKTYFYFSMRNKKRQEQLLLRKAGPKNHDIDSRLSNETFSTLCEIIKILVTYVLNPEFSPKSIALSLTRRGSRIGTEKVKKLFGIPDAVLSDMSPPIGKAQKAVFNAVPHKLCHYHFLKAVGKSLFSGKHDPIMISVKRMKEMLNVNRKELKNELNSFRNKKHHEDCAWLISLIDYINDYQKDLSGEGFPFDLPALAFYKRCETVFNTMERIFHDPAKNISGEINTTMYFIRNRIEEFFGYSHINQLKNLNDIFSELRDILHPETEKEKTPLNWGMLDSEIQVTDSTEKLEELRKKAEKKVKTKLSPYLMKAWKTITNRLKKYQGKLDPVIEFRGCPRK